MLQRPALLGLPPFQMCCAISRGAGAAHFFEQAGKGCGTLESNREAYGINSGAFLQQSHSILHTYFNKVLMGRKAEYLFETADEMKLGEPRLPRNGVEVYGLSVVRVYIHLCLYQPVVEVKVGICILAMH